MEVNRRQFLSYLGAGTAALASLATGIPALATEDQQREDLLGVDPDATRRPRLVFDPIAPSKADKLVLPTGFKYDVVVAYGDVINEAGDTFGFNNDFTVYFPIQGSSRGLLWVNHEYTNKLFVENLFATDAEKLKAHLYNQGGSIIEVYRDTNGSWKMDTTSKYARRVSGLTPIKLAGPAAGTSSVGGKTEVIGTFANCSGGKTLWNTLLTCEENFEYTCAEAGLDETGYGWVVEVAPFDASFAPRKQTGLGRFRHENASMGLANDGRVVVYMGDDKSDACVFKFISNGKFNEADGYKNSALLEDGTLYAANLKKGTWVPLNIEAITALLNDASFPVPSAVKKTKDQLKEMFKTQADVLVNANEAALLLGATPTDRPEDLEIHPFDHSIFIAHTNNEGHGNIHGHITRIVEKDRDLGALIFDFEIFAAGGTTFSAPDNLTFDKFGNLWTVTDMSSSNMHKGTHAKFANNGLFVIPTRGSYRGDAYQFASGPTDAELTGPWFTPDEKTLFLAVQHPGENTKDVKAPTSMWPHRAGDTMPRPSVVAITGF